MLVLRRQVIADHMRREGLDQETLKAALCEQGVTHLTEVEMAILEIDGSISVVPAGVEARRVKHPSKYVSYQ